MKLDQTDRDILQYLSEGLTAKEIGRKVYRSTVAVVKRIGKLKERLGAKNVTHLVSIAQKDGLLQNV